MKLYFTTLLLLIITQLSASVKDTVNSNKGKIYAYWGYNRSAFSKSDIHFKGPDYDFTLEGARAYDRPSKFNPNLYFNTKTLTIPQYNYRLGYFIGNNSSLSIGLDHMKYVVKNGQTINVTGNIPNTSSDKYAGTYFHDEVVLDKEFIRFEHTDGLNYLSIDYDYYHKLYKHHSGKFNLYFSEGLNSGLVIPRTEVWMFGNGINNRFHVAGYGIGSKAGIHFDFLKYFFIKSDVKGGFINLPNVLTTGSSNEKAFHHFWFIQFYTVFGFSFKI